jgi:ketosteroid isomerase-like protein
MKNTSILPSRYFRSLVAVLGSLVAVLGFVVVTGCPPLLHAQDAVTQELLRLEDAWGKAELAKDADALGRLLAEDFLATGADGTVKDKLHYLDEIRSNPGEYVSGQDSDLKVRIYGNTAVDTGLWTETVTVGSGMQTERYRWTSVWIRQADGKWLCVTMQTVRLPK